MAYFGLRLGATTTCVAVYKDSKVEVLANDAGDRVTPAVISYNDGELSVGLSSCRNPSNLIVYSKWLIGHEDLDAEDVITVTKRSLCKIVQTGNGELAYEMTDSEGKVATKVGVQHSLQLLFKKLLETAVSHSGVRGERNAVLTVPVHFNECQKQKIKSAAVSAGFKVLQVIHEPSSALLAYQIGQENRANKEPENVVVFRVGGTSVDATVILVRDSLYRILSTVHKPGLGGEMVTELLAENLAEEFKRKHRVDVQDKPRTFFKLRQAAESCKRVLSTISTTSCSVDSLHEGMDFSCTVSRARLESLLNNLIPRFIEALDEALANAKLKVGDIDKVVFVGGTCKIPRVQQVLTNYFSNADILNQYSPDEVLAIGAAQQASYLKGFEDKVVTDEGFILPTIAKSLYFKTYGDTLHLIFDEGTLVPATKDLKVPLNSGSTRLSLKVFQLDNEFQTESALATVVLNDLTSDSTVLATFRATRENTLQVTLKDQSTDRMQAITIA